MANKYLEIAEAKLDQNDHRGALANFHRAIRLDPSCFLAYRGRAWQHLYGLGGSGRARALADFIQANTLDPLGDSEPCYRALFDLIGKYTGAALYGDLLGPWSAPLAAKNHSWLRSFASRSSEGIPPASIDDLWDLYALSRINDALTYHFQPPPPECFEDRFFGHSKPLIVSKCPVSVEEYRVFFEAMGLTAVTQPDFCPFYHEIVEAEQALEEDSPITISGTFWPCLMLGPMLFSRAGVRVTGGSRFLCAKTAVSSPLYWTYLRRGRTAHDLSHGWATTPNGAPASAGITSSAIPSTTTSTENGMCRNPDLWMATV